MMIIGVMSIVMMMMITISYHYIIWKDNDDDKEASTGVATLTVKKVLESLGVFALNLSPGKTDVCGESWGQRWGVWRGREAALGEPAVNPTPQG